MASGVFLAVGCQGQVEGNPPGPGAGGSGATGGTGPGTPTGGTGPGTPTGGTSGPGSGSGGGTGTGSTVGTGSGGGTGTGSTVGTGSGGSGGPVGTGGAQALDCSKPRAAASRAQLLTSSQYSNTVLDLLGVGGNAGANLGDAVFATLDDPAVEQRATVAASIATTAAANLAKWSPCTPPATGSTAACETQIISTVGNRLYRRPLTTAEQTELKTLFDAGIKAKDFTTGVEWLLTGVLQSPDFMYQLVKPEPAEVAGSVRPLGAYEYASRTAYFLWDSPPDDKLLTAAANNEFADATKRQTHIDRMIQDPKFLRGVQHFYTQWLNLGAFSELSRNAAGFDLPVVQALTTSLLMGATQLYSAAAPNINGLFQGQSYYMNDILRKFYGLTGTGTAFTAVDMPGQSRRGLLTHPALMALLARPDESFPIARGLFVTGKLLCKDVPLPNGLVVPQLPPVQEGVSTRTRIEMHVSNAQCSFCHKLFDPPGFALESYDEVGRYRTMDHGVAVNTSGVMALGSDVDGPFATGDELLARIATSNEVRACFAQRYLRFALAQSALPSEAACSADTLTKSFVPTGDLKQLVSQLVSTDAFRQRLAEGVAP